MAQKVLVLSESFGMGHERAAQALVKGLKIIEPRIDTVHTTSIESSFPKVTGAFLKMYLHVIKLFPMAWHKLYQKSRVNMDNEFSNKVIFNLLAGGIKKILQEYNPGAIVCTHPFPASVISRFKLEGLNVPLAGIITDYDVHASWLNKNIDLYIVGDESLKSQFDCHGFCPNLVSGGGIPVDPLFGKRVDQEVTKKNIGMKPHQPMVLVAGGGWGLGNLGKIVELLTAMPEQYQINVITGTNKDLYETLVNKYRGKGHVFVQGLINNMHEYMSAADVLVTKPGGLTTSEALATGVPMIIFDVLYGQETWNAKFLVQNEAALKCSSLTEIPDRVREVIENKVFSEAIAQKAVAIGKPASGVDAAEKIMKLVV